MTKLVVDSGTLAKFNYLHDQAIICDEAGRALGVFYPAQSEVLQEGMDPPISEEELEERERAPEGRPLKEILADLERMA